MSSDDLRNGLTDSSEDDKATQPTITAIFRLLRAIQDGQTSLSSRFDRLESRFDTLESRFDKLESRFDKLESSVNSRFEALESRIDKLESSVNSRFESLESRLANDFAGIDTRFTQLSEEMRTAILQLSDKLSDRIDRSRLHAEADIEEITRRLRKLESKAS